MSKADAVDGADTGSAAGEKEKGAYGGSLRRTVAIALCCSFFTSGGALFAYHHLFRPQAPLRIAKVDLKGMKEELLKGVAQGKVTQAEAEAALSRAIAAIQRTPPDVAVIEAEVAVQNIPELLPPAGEGGK